MNINPKGGGAKEGGKQKGKNEWKEIMFCYY